ncbi:MAG TPA: acyl-ACP--UDP-N-acetylglucosamine O-acyltransferase [Caulobacteraceae bacterium]|jgi:UDP-N-acetylglucosamine acyltransferase|nr:acyl-ACP--UDP-N-acetylglucosamine O-acyltransferase [Caulobacteraceae bacterium]
MAAAVAPIERPQASKIHPTAVIEPGAELGEGVQIGPYSVIGAEVKIGDGNVIGPHVVIEGRTTIGARNRIYQFASIGAAPQDERYHGQPTELTIGDDNVIREYVTVQPGMVAEHPLTTVGSNNMFMALSHVAHDCKVGDGVRFANGATLAGHVEVGDYAWISGLVAIHQFARIGAHAFVAGGAMVPHDVPPFCLVQGDRARLVGLNEVGLKRHGYSAQEVLNLRRAYKILFRRPGTKEERMAQVQADLGESRGVADLLAFLETSKRAVMAR